MQIKIELFVNEKLIKLLSDSFQIGVYLEQICNCDINLFLPVYEADSPTTIDSGRGPVCTVSILEAITDGGPRHGGNC